MSKDNGGPAFPGTLENYKFEGCAGMTLRDYFAAKAMQGFSANHDFTAKPYDEIAEMAYLQADAMMEARK